MSVLQKLLAMLFLKSAPQDLPYSPRLTMQLTVIYLASGIIVLQTTMGPDEIMLEIQAGPIEAGMGTAFLKTARVGADISKVTCAVSLKREGASCDYCRIAMGAVAPVPIRVKAAEGMIQGQKVDASLIERVGKKVSEEIRPIDDVRSTAEYRRDLAGVMFKDVFWKAWHRAGGEEN